MLVGSMIIRNEADRYLQASLTRLLSVCDKVFVADDNSEDDSAAIAERLGAKVWKNNSTPFAKSEREFRQNAWNKMASMMRLKEGRDWVLSVDADEYVVGDKSKFQELIRQASHRTCFTLPIKEMWGVDQYRIDGFWDGNRNRRMGLYKKDMTFRNANFGCGSIPHHNHLATELSEHMGILHFGYADPEDRQKKYDFYKSLPNHGHNEKHIESIIQTPKLQRIKLDIDFYKGLK